MTNTEMKFGVVVITGGALHHVMHRESPPEFKGSWCQKVVVVIDGVSLANQIGLFVKPVAEATPNKLSSIVIPVDGVCRGRKNRKEQLPRTTAEEKRTRISKPHISSEVDASSKRPHRL